ncbi:MAG: hypothetical protein GYA58_12145, partial [Anaerolineaceae bacterium]|nr:hypothetical protein [Anaerolineaceae bacterium]
MPDKPAEMTLIDHIEELRHRLLIALIALGLGVVASLVFGEQIVKFLTLPIGGVEKLQSIEITENLGVFMRVSLLTGVIIAFPVLIYELLMFVLPGLKPNEKRFVVLSIPLATRLTPKQIIPTAVSACLAFLILTMVFPASATILWVAAFGLGFFMAPVWPTGFTLAGQSVNLSGRVSSLILLGDSFGGMVLPTLVGKVIEGSGPRMMVYL